ncbi:MAG: DinB family protein [Blastocatellia bacterium]
MTSSNIHLLEQGANLLAQLDDQLYLSAPAGISKSGIGGHLRHCLDFYDGFLRGVKAGKVNYDLRERNELIEKDRFVAMTKIRETVDRLNEVSDSDDSDLLVKLEGEQAQSESAWSRSSINRELQFLLSHTVHHYALIAVLLRLQGFQPSPDFGVAPTTLKFWQAKA